MKSEVVKQLEEDVMKIGVLVDSQKLTVGKAKQILNLYSSILRRMEQLEESRNKWRAKAIKCQKK